MILFAAANGYLDEWSEDEVSRYESQMLENMEAKHPDLLNEIKESSIISDDLENKLKKALDEFKSNFQPSA